MLGASLACIAIASVIGVGAEVGTAQAAPSQRGLHDVEDVQTFLDELMDAEMARLDIPGAVVVVVDSGETLFSAGYGFADRENRLEVDPATTLFGIGSVSKPLTAVAALQQVERGTVALDTEVEEVLEVSVPEHDGTAVTLGSLLTHTSGFEERLIGYWTEDADDVGPLSAFVRDHVPSRFAATGAVHSYSNHNYAFAGAVVEEVSGQDFVTYMDDDVFGPLGMDSTGFLHDIPTTLAARVAVGYGGDEGSRRPIDRVYDHEFPAGEVVTSGEDMASFMIALLEGGRDRGAAVMSTETTDLYLAPAYRPDPDMPGRTTGGLEELWINGEHAVGHGGDSLAGFAAEMVLLPEHDTGLFLAYNVESDEFRTTVVRAVFDEFFPDESPPPTFLDLDDGELERFAGTYRWTRFARSTADKVLAMTPPYNTYVEAGDGTVTVRWLGVSERWVYRPIGPTVLERVSGEPAVVDGLVLDPGDRISFTVDDDGDVAYLHTSLHTIALEKVPYLSLGIVHISAFGTIVIVFVLSLVIWPIGAFVRARRNRRRAARAEATESVTPSVTSGPPDPVEPTEADASDEPAAAWPAPTPVVVSDAPDLLPPPTMGERVALWLEIFVAVALLLGTAAFFAALADTDVAFGPTLALYLATGLITIGSVVGLALIPAAVGAWIRGWFTIGGRIFYSLLALTSPYLLWWAISWNFFGFQF